MSAEPSENTAPSESTAPAENPAVSESAGQRRRSVLTLVTVIVFGLFYAYDLWEGVNDLIQVPEVYRANHLDVAGAPWGLLIAGVATPIVVFFAALLVARRQNFLGRCAILFVGLAVTAALSLAIIELPSLI